MYACNRFNTWVTGLSPGLDGAYGVTIHVFYDFFPHWHWVCQNSIIFMW